MRSSHRLGSELPMFMAMARYVTQGRPFVAGSVGPVLRRPKLLELALQSRAADAEQLGGARAVPLRLSQHRKNVFVLDIIEGRQAGLCSRHRSTRKAQLQRQVCDFNRRPAAEDERPLQGVAQLADVAGPVVSAEG